MMDSHNLRKRAERIKAKAARRARFKRIVALMAVFVLVLTTVRLTMPANAVTPALICGLEEHTHTEACYSESGELICGLEEHTHSEDCYEKGGTLTASAEDGALISCAYEAGILHEGTAMTVRQAAAAETEQIRNTVNAIIGDASREASVLQPYEISFVYNDSGEVEPDGNVDVTVQFAVPVAAASADTEWRLYHITDDGQAQDVTGSALITTDGSNNVNGIRFSAGSFSFYALAGIDAAEQSETAEAAAASDAKENAESEAAESKTPKAPAKAVRKAPQAAPVDLAGYLSGASLVIDGQEVSAGQWDGIKVNKDYKLKLSFKESGSHCFPDDDTPMVYKLPDGLEVKDLETTFDCTIGSVRITGNKLIVNKDAGTVTMIWNTQDPNFAALTQAPNVSMDAELEASFDGSRTSIDFGNGVTKEVTIDDTKGVSINKDGTYDPKTNRINYTLEVTATGDNTNIVVTDEIAGTALTYRHDAAAASKNGGPVGAIDSETDKGFTWKIPEMKNGEVVTITYSADVDLSKIGSENGTVEQTQNGVKVHSDQQPGDDEDKLDFYNKIRYTSLDKSNGTITKDGEDKKTVSWSITYNKEKYRAAGGATITDKMETSSDKANVMSYSGDGIKITVKDANGNTVRSETKSWGDLGIDPATATSWQYTIPETDTEPYEYLVEYTTDVDMTNVLEERDLRNTGDDGKGNSSTGVIKINPGEENTATLKKYVEKASYEDGIDWKIEFEVPANGLKGTELRDYIPKTYFNGKDVYDTLDTSTVQVEGLVDGETWVPDYDPEYADANEARDKYFAIYFYKSAEQTDENKGLKGTGEKRKVTVTFRTLNNKEWLTYAEGTGVGQDFKQHTNKSRLYTNDSILKSDATATLSLVKFKKSHEKGSNEDQYENVTENGVKYPIYRYNLDIEGYGDLDEKGIDITDTYDPRLALTSRGYSGTDTPIVRGGNWDPNGPWVAVGSENVKIDEANHTITFHLSSANVPKDNDGKQFAKLKIVYDMKPKDEAALKEIQEAAVASGTWQTTLDNSATFNGEITRTDKVTYQYNPLEKVYGTDGYNGWDASNTDYPASFTIKANPGKVQLNGGQPLTLTDAYENLSVDLSSITITATGADGSDRKEEVSYNFKGNTGTFIIPDETYVEIFYRARPTQAGKVTFKNTAEMSGQSDTVEKTENFEASASARGNIPKIRIYKYMDGNMMIPLGNAVFALCDKDGNIINYDGGAKAGSPITFTTGPDGYITIRWEKEEYSQEMNFNTRYYFKEIQAPTYKDKDGKDISFEKSDTIFTFMIDENGVPDYKNFTYVNNEVIQVSNKPKKNIDVVLTKVDTANTQKTLDGAEFSLYGEDYVGADGTVNAAAQPEKTGIATAGGGKAELGVLESGTYYLVETKAPDNYVKYDGYIKLVVSSEKVTVVQGTARDEVTPAADEEDPTRLHAEIQVTNSKGYKLPLTGGTGTSLYFGFGALLMLASATLLVHLNLNRKRQQISNRNRRTNRR